MNTFKEGLANGDKEMIYPILRHLLSKLPELRKRAYLARFLTGVEIPEDMFADPEVSNSLTHSWANSLTNSPAK